MFIYAANWKMRMSFDEAIAFCKENYSGLVLLAKLKGKEVVLLPEFTQIKSIHDIFEGSRVCLGAQDCSAIESGPFTGQVPVLSLEQIGCRYCIVWHSEMQEFRKESPEQIAAKILCLDNYSITPILCVGESKQDFSDGKTENVIEGQLEPVFELIAGFCERSFYVAYEPVWAIGSGVTPEIWHIEKVFDLILQLARKFRLENKIKLMYGGSVDENNAKNLKNIKNLGGFLLGSVSLDFKKFKKIVEL